MEGPLAFHYQVRRAQCSRDDLSDEKLWSTLAPLYNNRDTEKKKEEQEEKTDRPDEISSFSLSCLSPDMLSYVMSMLTFSERLTCRCVCRLFRRKAFSVDDVRTLRGHVLMTSSHEQQKSLQFFLEQKKKQKKATKEYGGGGSDDVSNDVITHGGVADVFSSVLQDYFFLCEISAVSRVTLSPSSFPLSASPNSLLCNLLLHALHHLQHLHLHFGEVVHLLGTSRDTNSVAPSLVAQTIPSLGFLSEYHNLQSLVLSCAQQHRSFLRHAVYMMPPMKRLKKLRILVEGNVLNELHVTQIDFPSPEIQLPALRSLTLEDTSERSFAQTHFPPTLRHLHLALSQQAESKFLKQFQNRPNLPFLPHLKSLHILPNVNRAHDFDMSATLLDHLNVSCAKFRSLHCPNGGLEPSQWTQLPETLQSLHVANIQTYSLLLPNNKTKQNKPLENDPNQVEEIRFWWVRLKQLKHLSLSDNGRGAVGALDLLDSILSNPISAAHLDDNKFTSSSSSSPSFCSTEFLPRLSSLYLNISSRDAFLRYVQRFCCPRHDYPILLAFLTDLRICFDGYKTNNAPMETGTTLSATFPRTLKTLHLDRIPHFVTSSHPTLSLAQISHQCPDLRELRLKQCLLDVAQTIPNVGQNTKDGIVLENDDMWTSLLPPHLFRLHMEDCIFFSSATKKSHRPTITEKGWCLLPPFLQNIPRLDAVLEGYASFTLE